MTHQSPDTDTGLANDERHEDRDRGAISSADREFLRTGGENLKNAQIRSKTRRRVFDRVRDAIIDFGLLDKHIDNRGVEDIFQRRGDWTDDAFREGVEGMLAVLYRGAELDTNELDFETALYEGVHSGERRQYDEPVIVNVNFDVNVADTIDTDEALEKYQNGNWLSTGEIGALLATGTIDAEDAEDLANYARTNSYFPRALDPLSSEGVTHPPAYRGSDGSDSEGESEDVEE